MQAAASEVFTTVNVVGVARAPYNMVAFSVQIEGEGKTLAEAKKKLGERVQLVEECVKKLVDAGTLRIEADSEKRLPSTQYGMDYNKKPPVKKTTCRYSFSFASADVSCADAVMDALSSIDSAGIGTYAIHGSLIHTASPLGTGRTSRHALL